MRLASGGVLALLSLAILACGSSASTPGVTDGGAPGSGGTPAAGAPSAGANSAGAGGIAGANTGNGGTGAASSGAAGSAGSNASGTLMALAGASRYAAVGEDVVLDGSASVGAATYQWNFGNGNGNSVPQASAAAHVSYAKPGRYHAVLTVANAAGATDTAEVVITVTYPATFQARGSSTIAPLSNGKFAWVSPDSNQVVIVLQKPDHTFAVDRRIATAANPRTVVEWQGAIAVACQGAGTVEIHPLEAGPMIASLALPYGSAPYGVADGDSSLFVSLEGTGKLAVIQLGAGNVPGLVRIVDAVVDARGVAPLPDGRVAVTRLRSPDARGEVAFVNPADGTSTIVPLAFDPQGASDAEIGGVPTYLSAFVVSPTGREAVVPSLIANIADGVYRDKVPFTFDQTVRAVLSRIDLTTNLERFVDRVQFDDRGFAIAAAYSKHGDFTYIAMPGNRLIEQIDLLNGTAAGTYEHSGYAPDGVVLTGDDRFLLAAAYLSRELTIYDTTQNGSEPVQHLALLDSEPLPAAVLRGKQLFNDSSDARIASSGYIACADCHLDGDSDGRVWDFTQRGEGLRNTTSLLGHAGTGDGPIHWTGNFDEVQDFEGDIRNQFKGTGLMSDADFNTGTRSQSLGDKKAGISPDLDALAAYLNSLKAEPVSPFRAADGSLTAAAQRGKVLFESTTLGCTTCHSGARLTDSHFITPTQPLLHDVGTLTPASGQRLGQPLTGIDTPTLHSLWTSAPYLHDGSAATVRDVLTTHNLQNQHGHTTQLSSANLDDLVEYLLSLDGRRD